MLTKYVHRYISPFTIFLIDMFVSVMSSLVVLLLVNRITVRDLWTLQPLLLWLGSSALFSMIFILVLRTNMIIIRHMTIREFGRFIMVSFCKVMSMGFMFALIDRSSDVLYLMMIADFFFTLFAFFFIRVLMLMAYDHLRERAEFRKKCQNVLIYGVAEKSVSLISRLQNSEHYRVVGFIQFGSQSLSHVIAEKKVHYVANPKMFANVVTSTEADALMFASEEDAKAEKNRLIQYAIDVRIKNLIVPSIDEIKDGKLNYSVRNIQIEDLLMRQEINISMKEVTENFKNRTVLVTGAAGSIGSELCRQLACLGVRKLILLDNAETPMHNLRLELEEKFPELDFTPVIGDVRLPQRLDSVFRNWRPEIVFHAAAYKHVPLMEEFPRQAILTNILGTKNVADMAIKYGTKRFVMISTDKAVNPTNVMGASKRIAEIYVQSLYLKLSKSTPDCTKFITTRFGNVLGSNGSVVPYFKKQIAAGGPVTVTHPDIIRFFMTIPEASSLVLEAAALSNGGEIFCFDMGHPVKIADLARNMIRLAGYEPGKDIEIIYTGLRPGEKLYEELLNQKELTIPTINEKILVAKVREYDFDIVATEIQSLIEEAKHGKAFPCVQGMKKIVPEYKSKNSIYEQLDK